MATYLILHDVDDVDLWLSSASKRDDAFAPLGLTLRTFRDTQSTNRVGLIAEIPDMDAFQAYMQTDDAAAAMKHDGVHPGTLVVLAEA